MEGLWTGKYKSGSQEDKNIGDRKKQEHMRMGEGWYKLEDRMVKGVETGKVRGVKAKRYMNGNRR